MANNTASETSVGSLTTVFEDNESAWLDPQGTIKATIFNKETPPNQEEVSGNSLCTQRAETEVSIKSKYVAIDGL